MIFHTAADPIYFKAFYNAYANSIKQYFDNPLFSLNFVGSDWQHPAVDYFFHDASTSTDYKFYHTKVAANSHDNAVHNALVLEEGDYLQFQSDNAGKISGQISYALLTRTGENG